jgi:hypothetical protein
MAAMATLVVALAMAAPAFSQGKSQQAQGKSGRGSSPNRSTLPPPPAVAAPAGTVPFSWMDDANVMAPNTVWLGISTVRWQGAGLSEVSMPVIDGAIGLSPRVQLGASIPRVMAGSDSAGLPGGLGTTYFSAKISMLPNDARDVKLAVAPTLQVLSRVAIDSGPELRRAQWGLPVSIELDRGAGRLYGSAGYFSPGVWYAGTGVARTVHARASVSVSFSRAWTDAASVGGTISSPSRNELSGGAFVEITRNLGVFGSIGRTIRTADENGAGTIVGIGLSVTARPVVATK